MNLGRCKKMESQVQHLKSKNKSAQFLELDKCCKTSSLCNDQLRYARERALLNSVKFVNSVLPNLKTGSSVACAQMVDGPRFPMKFEPYLDRLRANDPTLTTLSISEPTLSLTYPSPRDAVGSALDMCPKSCACR